MHNITLTSATIESPAGNELQLLSPWKTVFVNGREARLDAGSLVLIHTKPGQVLHFSETSN